jgi:RNA polymerase sigma factor (TIGR02999 family)
MRSILVDHARAKSRRKRTPLGPQIPLDEIVSKFEESAGSLVDLDDALDALRKEDPQAEEIVRLRYFAQLSMQDISDVLGVPKRTVERDWAHARVFLKRAMSP